MNDDVQDIVLRELRELNRRVSRAELVLAIIAAGTYGGKLLSVLI